MMESFCYLTLLLSVLFSIFDVATSFYGGPLTLLVSFDGFRWDYLHRVETPNIDQVIASGAYVPGGISAAFITKTFPNHFTLATGLWEESHGVVSNHMYDPNLRDHFALDAPDSASSKWWDVGAEPIWVTNQLQGGKTGVFFWPGSESEIKGVRPYHFMNYSTSTPFKDRVDGVINWFTAEEDPINLGLMYFNEPDYSGHHFGPESPEILDAIKMCDDTVGYLIQRLQEVDLYDKINIIITSDHGMAELSPDRVIELNDYISSDLYDMVDTSPIAAINPYDSQNTMVIYNALANAHPNMTVYLKDNIPDHFHYKHHRRIMPIIAAADEGWTITQNKTDFKGRSGGHGYDNRYKSMRPFFIAHGPAIKKNFTLPQFRNVDIYQLICKIMNLKAAPNNGSLDIAGDMLMIQRNVFPDKTVIATATVFAVVLLALAVASAVTWTNAKQRKRNQRDGYDEESFGTPLLK